MGKGLMKVTRECVGSKLTNKRKEKLEQHTRHPHKDPEGGICQEMSTQRDAPLRNDEITGLFPVSVGEEWVG
jgi:hypothetical protein